MNCLKALPLSIGALLATVPIQAQAPSATADFSSEALRAHIAHLADDRLEGRAPGTPGYDAAARYVAEQFESLGLRPAAGGRWLQPVDLVRYGVGGSPRLAINGRSFRHGDELAFRASPQRGPLRVEAPLVFVGYGLDAPRYGLRDYAGLDVRGKVVVVMAGHPGGLPSDVGAHLNGDKPRIAAAHGAVGMIVVRSRAAARATPWREVTAAADRPLMTWSDHGRPHQDDGLQFVAAADGPAATALFEGARRSFEQVRTIVARRGARPRGFALPGRVRFERGASTTTSLASFNVLGMIPGSDPALAGEQVLLMAHLDGLGVAAEGRGDRIRNGAMDNASGVAVLIEVARTLMRPGNRPRRPVLLAAVTGEEDGLLGSHYLASHPVADGRVVAVVNLDMPILTYDFEDVVAFGAEHSTLGPIVQRAASRMDVAVIPDPLPGEGLFTRSDHYSFVRAGIPSVFLMTGFGGEGGARFRGFLAATYHSPEDDLSQPFNWRAASRFVELNYRIVREIADRRDPPFWYADSFFGRTFSGDHRFANRPVAPRTQATSRLRAE